MRKIFFFIVFAFVFSGCAKKEKEIVLNKDDFSALSPLIKWAVVKEPYATIRSTPSLEADAAGYCRKGDVLQIEGMSISDGEKWYLVNGGYLRQNSIQLYSNRYRAESESRLITE